MNTPSSLSTKARLALCLMPLTIGAFLFVFTAKAHAMGKMYLFSAVQGVVVQKGKPVEGAVVEREYFWHWKDKRDKVQVKTGATGGFNFPEATGSSILGSLLPHEPVIQQTIRIIHQGQTYMAWAYDKGDYEANTELEGKPISLICDLDQPPSHKGPRERVYGICQLR